MYCFSMEGQSDDHDEERPLIKLGSDKKFDLSDFQFEQKVSKKDIVDLIQKRTGQDNLARTFLEGNYESRPRPIRNESGKNVHGLGYPVNPEFLFELMTHCENKIVLELGAADGINSILLALAGAKKVYINDIEKTEIEKLKIHKSQLTRELKRKVEINLGDCFKYLKQFREDSIDILIIRNLLHFFKSSQQEKLLAEAYRVLKSGGIIHITTNGKQPRLIHLFPEDTVFKRQAVFIDTAMLTSTYAKSDPTLINDLDPLSYQNENIGVITHKGEEGYYLDSNKMKTLPEECQKEVEKKLSDKLSNCETGTVLRLLKNTIISFSLDQIIEKARSNRFVPLKASKISYESHAYPTVHDDNKEIEYLVSLEERPGYMVGIIAKKE